MNCVKKYLIYVFVVLASFVFTTDTVFAEECTNPNHSGGKHYTCIHFINEYDGKEVRKSCAPEGTSGTKSYTHNSVKETNHGSVFTLVGWFDAEGNQVSDNAKVRVSYKASSEKCEDLYFYLRWEEQKAPILVFNYIDKVSTGSGSWTNSNGVTSGYTHTFKQPDAQDHFSFLYWAIDKNIYNDGDKFSYSFEGKEMNTSETVEAYAWWQSSVTLNLYDEDTLLKTQEDFEKVSIDYEPSKKGYIFDGWVDEEGNKVTEDTFYPLDSSVEKVVPRVVNLYATWIKEKTEEKVTPKNEKNVKTTKTTVTVLPPDTGI